MTGKNLTMKPIGRKKEEEKNSRKPLAFGSFFFFQSSMPVCQNVIMYFGKFCSTYTTPHFHLVVQITFWMKITHF